MDSNEEIPSIFFFEFSERISSAYIFKLFGYIGDMVEVVIPPRRSNMGKQFGFARFRGVEDSRLLAVKLDNILIDGNKIQAHLTRFDRVKVKGRMRVISGRKSGHNKGPVANRRGVDMKGNSRFLGAKNFAYAISEGENKVI